MVKKARTNELELIQAAKLGDLAAKDTLLRNLWDFMKKTHEYGPDGSKSQAKPCLRSTFEEALADMDLPELFEKCVQTYDPARGTFRNHLAFRMRMAAKDRVRDKTKIMQGKKEPKDALDSIFLSEREFQGYGHTEESADLEEDVRGGIPADKLLDFETEQEWHDNVFEFIDYIVDYFGEGSIEARYVELVCKLGVDGKKHTNEICKELGCSRQNLTIIKRRIAAKLGDAYRTRLCA